MANAPETIAMRGSTPPDRVLLLRFGALGDLVFLAPVVALLRRAWPEAELHWAVKAPFEALIAGLPGVTRSWPLRKGMPALFALARDLRKQRFDLVLDYHANLRSGVVSRISGAPDRVGFARPFNKEANSLFNHHRVAPPSLDTHKIERNLFLTRCLPGVDPAWPGVAPDWSRCPDPSRVEALLSDGGPVVLLQAGASRKGAIKRWLVERNHELCRRLVADGAVPLVLWGSAEERTFAEELVRAVPGARAPVTRLDLPELVALFRRAACLVGIDSGPTHLASSAGLPVVGLYGPKSPAIYRPWFPGARVLSANERVACPPCNATHCKNPAGRVCMEALEVDEVHAAVREVLAG